MDAMATRGGDGSALLMFTTMRVVACATAARACVSQGEGGRCDESKGCDGRDDGEESYQG